MVSVVGVAAVVVVGAAWAATVCVVLLSFLPISTPSRRNTPRRAMAPIAITGDHWVLEAAGAGPPAIAGCPVPVI